MRLIMVFFDCRFLQSAVHSLDLAVCPGVVRLGQPVLDAMLVADPVEQVNAVSRGRAGGVPPDPGPESRYRRGPGCAVARTANDPRSSPTRPMTATTCDAISSTVKQRRSSPTKPTVKGSIPSTPAPTVIAMSSSACSVASRISGASPRATTSSRKISSPPSVSPPSSPTGLIESGP